MTSAWKRPESGQSRKGPLTVDALVQKQAQTKADRERRDALRKRLYLLCGVGLGVILAGSATTYGVRTVDFGEPASAKKPSRGPGAQAPQNPVPPAPATTPMPSESPPANSSPPASQAPQPVPPSSRPPVTQPRPPRQASCRVSSGHLRCGNDSPIWVYGSADSSSNRIDRLRSKSSYFDCYLQKDSGAVWFFVKGSDNGAWGWIPAERTHASSAIKTDPGSQGINRCNVSYDEVH